MQLIAQNRKQLGKKSKNLRKERKLPAVVFGKGIKSIPLFVDLIQFSKAYKESGETSLIDLVLEDAKKTEKVLIKEVQVDPITSAYIHANFYKVNLKEKITATVPIKVVGADKSPILKSGGGLLLTLLDEIEVEALPTDLPHEFVVDVSHLTELEQGVAIGELKYDREKVEITEYDDDELILKVDYAKMEEEKEEEVSEAAAIAAVEATQELTEEEKAKRAAEKEASEESEEMEKD